MCTSIILLQITEDLFVQVAIDFAEGDFQAPSFFAEQDLSEEQLADFNKANIFKKVNTNVKCCYYMYQTCATLLGVHNSYTNKGWFTI